MTVGRHALTSMAVLLAAALLAPPESLAARYRVTRSGPPPQTVIQRAVPGDTVVIEAGRYRVNLVIDKPLTVEGEPGAVLDGGGRGDVVRVSASGVTLRGLAIRGSGLNLTEMNAGIFVERNAADVTIENNRLDDVAFGIWLDGCSNPRIAGNRIHGIPELRSQDRGNGIHLFNVQGAVVTGNEIWETRDGIYLDNTRQSVLHDNDIHDLRFGIHYMYSRHNRVTGNRTRNTRTGYALMQSDHLLVAGNRSEDDRNYGILMNYITHSRILGNVVTGAGRGEKGARGTEGKAVFIYNSLYNEIHDNVFAGSDIGIHLTAGSEDNEITGNAFVGNRSQVKYVATRPQEWSRDGRGNYWSDYVGWDLDADGVGDRPYEPVDGVDRLLWKYPLAKILMNSPAVATLRWVQHRFPVLKPPGVRDSHPLMAPPVHLEKVL